MSREQGSRGAATANLESGFNPCPLSSRTRESVAGAATLCPYQPAVAWIVRPKEPRVGCQGKALGAAAGVVQQAGSRLHRQIRSCLHHPALPRAGEVRAGLLVSPRRRMPMLLHGGKSRCEQCRWRLEGNIRCLRHAMGRASPCLPASDPAILRIFRQSGIRSEVLIQSSAAPRAATSMAASIVR